MVGRKLGSGELWANWGECGDLRNPLNKSLNNRL